MNRNKELFKWLGISICVFFLSFIFMYIYEEVDYSNNFYSDFEYLDNVPSDGKNAHLYLNGFGSQFIYVMTSKENEDYSYYVYLNEEGNNVLVKVNESDAKSCSKNDYWDDVNCYLEGGVYLLNDDLKKDVLNELNKYGYSIELDNLYLDTELKLYRDSGIYELLYICCLCFGVFGTIVCLILLIKNNFEKLRNNKLSIGKWIYRLSFLVYGVILMISIIAGFNYGFDEFLVVLLIAGIICTLIPILPAVLIYQIVYLIIKKKK